MDEKKQQALNEEKDTFAHLFEQATLIPIAHLIKGVICVYRVEEIEALIILRRMALAEIVFAVPKLFRGRKLSRQVTRRVLANARLLCFCTRGIVCRWLHPYIGELGAIFVSIIHERRNIVASG